MEKNSWNSVLTTNHRSGLPTARWGHACCVINDQIVLFGGYADSNYMNDVWVFDVTKMEWREVITTGDIPSCRSNSSLNYDHVNNRIIVFGGGGPNRKRFNSINVLDWKTKQWTQIIPDQSQSAPWQRTYHSGQLIYPYLIVFGGQGVADLDDLWAFNLETCKWKEIQTNKNYPRPCHRRFHSSCMIGNEFYVIAGCHSKYRCISDIFSIDLTKFIEGQNIELEWKQKCSKNTGFLMRWGHTSRAFDGKIYIFGGRFCNDLNDLLVFDPALGTIRTLKVLTDSMPNPRRRPSTCFIGSCLIMFGGFNSDYYNDLHFINVAENKVKPLLSLNPEDSAEYVNNQKFSDSSLRTNQGVFIHCHKGLLQKYFNNEEEIDKFLNSIDGVLSEKELVQMLEQMYIGYGKSNFLKHNIQMPMKKEEKQKKICQNLQQKYSSFYNFKSSKKNEVVGLNDDDFGDFLEVNREKVYKDLKIIINKSFIIESCKVRLALANKYFQLLLSGKYKTTNEIQINLPTGNIVLFEILINYLLEGILVVPTEMTTESWMQLYSLADYFCVRKLQNFCQSELFHKISPKTVDQIFQFSLRENLESLAQLCANSRLRFMEKTMLSTLSENFFQHNSFKNDRYLKKSFEDSRFEINQKLLNRVQDETQLLKKKSSTSTLQKENLDVFNQ